VDLRREPYPYREDPYRQTPPASTGGEQLSPWLAERMFEQRIIFIRGHVDAAVASQAAGALLTLGALGSEPVQLHLSAPNGELSAAFAIVDAIDAVAVPVHAVVTSEAGGAATAILAAADRRFAFKHARIRLAEPKVAAVAGTADEVTAAAGQYLRELEELAVRLAEVTGQTRSRIEDDLSAGRTLTSEQARDYGLIDEIIGKA
jgi:ATP-dependent Clp protease, protease subunit